MQCVACDAKTAAVIAYYDLTGKKLKEKLPVTSPIEPDSLQFMRDEDVFVIVLMNAYVTFTDLENDERSFSFRTKAVEGMDDVTAVAIGTDGKILASSLYNGACLKIWNISQVKAELREKKSQNAESACPEFKTVSLPDGSTEFYTREGEYIITRTRALNFDDDPALQAAFERSLDLATPNARPSSKFIQCSVL